MGETPIKKIRDENGDIKTATNEIQKIIMLYLNIPEIESLVSD